MEVSWFLPTLIIALVATTLLHKFLTRNKNPKKLPPSPKGIPILGHLHMLGKNPHQDLHKIAQKHGPIMYMKFGLSPIVVVSSAEAAELFLKTHDLVFASRPPLLAAKYMSWGQSGLTFAEYGPYWRNMRKLCTLQLLSSLKIASFQSMRRQELGIFVESLEDSGGSRILYLGVQKITTVPPCTPLDPPLLEEAARGSVAVDLSAKISSLTAEMSCRMLCGKKYDDKEIDERGFKSVIQQGMHLAAVPNLGDYYPVLGVLDLQGLTRKMKKLAKVFDAFFERVLDDHVRDHCGDDADAGEMKDDIVGTMMAIMQTGGESEFQFDRRHVKAVLLDMLAASMDTAASTVEWILSELLKNPRIMTKVQKEVEQVVGLDRMVDEADLERLEYLDMVVKETFRLHPVGPLLLPHYSMEDCTVNGYHIPKRSRIIVNTYAIGRDPNAWPDDPEKFVPERFVIGSDIDVRGQHFQLLPFGAGRRGCPGIQLGLIQVRLIVAQLVHCFDWRLPDNVLPEKLDMSEEFGLVVARANHLVATPTLRLHNYKYLY